MPPCQVDFVKHLYDKLQELHAAHDTGPMAINFPRPSFKARRPPPCAVRAVRLHGRPTARDPSPKRPSCLPNPPPRTKAAQGTHPSSN